MILPLMVGVLSGGVIVGSMYRIGLLTERSGLAILVCAIAAFYPVFAFSAGAGFGAILFHILVFGAFTAAAAWGFHTGAAALAVLLISHGLFDAVITFTKSPAPDWWPSFCAGLDIAAGAGLLTLLYRKDIPA